MSASSRPTLHPRLASAQATLAETVLLPTPPLPEPTSTTFLTEGTRSLGLCCLTGEGRTLPVNATSTRGSFSADSAARTDSSMRGLCGEAGVGSSTRTRTPPPSRISGCLRYASSDRVRPDEGSLRSFRAARTCSAVTAIGRGNVSGRRGQVKESRRAPQIGDTIRRITYRVPDLTSVAVQQRPPRAFARALAAVEHQLAVDHHVGDALRIGEGLLERGRVPHGGGIEHHQIGLHPRPDQPPVLDPQAPRRQRGHLPHRLLHREEVLVARVVPQHPRRAAERPRMRAAL